MGAPVDEFKLAMRRLAGHVGIIATQHETTRCGMAVTAIASVSANPPSILVSVNRNASTNPVLRAARLFSANLLKSDQAALCTDFSGKFDQAERFNRSKWSTDDRGIPYLPDAQANFFCEVVELVEYESHTIFIAKVLDAISRPSVDPLLYVDGRCRLLAPEVP